ncbi:MAG: hypothetical protein LUG91_05775 [Ruminococcus sp.]|nr:hypothetical protein [Ruminococcus sp.]
MAFCKFCGKQISEGTVCDECKANQPEAQPAPEVNYQSPVDQAPVADQAPADGGAGGNDKKKLIVAGGIAVVAIIIIIAIISSIAGGGYKDPINDFIKGINKADSQKVMEACFPKDWLEEMADDEDLDLKELYDELDEEYEDVLDDWEDYYGKNVKLSFDFEDKKELSSKKLSNYEDDYDDYYDMDVEITKGYKVSGTLTIEGKDDDDEEDIEIIVVKIKGEGWFVCLSDGDLADFVDF